MEYKKGRINLSATIFVPYDCDNNCPFCTTKSEYENCEFNLDEILNKIHLLSDNEIITEYVLTGDEPFADIGKLKEILDAMSKPVYINTTLPISTFGRTVQLINEQECIKGINISRHMGFDFKNVASIEEIDYIEKPIRINTILPKNFTDYELIEFCCRYGKKGRDINLRADYREIDDLEKLKNFNGISLVLTEIFDYIETESCLVCNTEYYSVDNEFICSYHRGMQYSSFPVGGKIYINDVLVKPDGNIYKDWDFVPDKEFEKWILVKA